MPGQGKMKWYFICRESDRILAANNGLIMGEWIINTIFHTIINTAQFLAPAFFLAAKLKSLFLLSNLT